MLEQVLASGRYSAYEYVRARGYRSRLYTEVRQFFGGCDLLLTPVMPVAAWGVEYGSEPTEIGGRATPTVVDRVPFTYEAARPWSQHTPHSKNSHNELTIVPEAAVSDLTTMMVSHRPSDTPVDMPTP